MPYRICKTFEVESGHMLSRHPDLCRFPHGHTRTVEFVLEAADLDGNDMVCDFKAIRETIGDFLDLFDHSLCVNTEDPTFDRLKEMYGDRVIGFDGKDPTTEVIARTMHDELTKRLTGVAPVRDVVRVVRVRVWETSSSWAEYVGE